MLQVAVEIEQGFFYGVTRNMSYKILFMEKRNLVVTNQIARFVTSMISYGTQLSEQRFEAVPTKNHFECHHHDITGVEA